MCPIMFCVFKDNFSQGHKSKFIADRKKDERRIQNLSNIYDGTYLKSCARSSDINYFSKNLQLLC